MKTMQLKQSAGLLTLSAAALLSGGPARACAANGKSAGSERPKLP